MSLLLYVHKLFDLIKNIDIPCSYKYFFIDYQRGKLRSLRVPGLTREATYSKESPIFSLLHFVQLYRDFKFHSKTSNDHQVSRFLDI